MSDHSSWTDAKRLNLPSNRMTRLLRHNRSASITEGFPLIAAPGEFEIAFGQAVPDLDAPTVPTARSARTGSTGRGRQSVALACNAARCAAGTTIGALRCPGGSSITCAPAANISFPRCPELNKRSSELPPLQKNGKPRSQKRRRGHVVNFRCDDAELANIKAAARAAETTIADYCRRAALAQDPL